MENKKERANSVMTAVSLVIIFIILIAIFSLFFSQILFYIILVILSFLFGLCFYFIPTIIAVFRGKRNALAIFVTNLLLGWTVFGWIAALVWATIKD